MWNAGLSPSTSVKVISALLEHFQHWTMGIQLRAEILVLLFTSINLTSSSSRGRCGGKYMLERMPWARDLGVSSEQKNKPPLTRDAVIRVSYRYQKNLANLLLQVKKSRETPKWSEIYCITTWGCIPFPASHFLGKARVAPQTKGPIPQLQAFATDHEPHCVLCTGTRECGEACLHLARFVGCFLTNTDPDI